MALYLAAILGLKPLLLKLTVEIDREVFADLDRINQEEPVVQDDYRADPTIIITNEVRDFFDE